LLLAVEIVIVLMAAHGHLVYPLEAAYTHLALAEQISVGHYGLVAGEAAAPSSSILYPFLLAALRPFGLGVMLPHAFPHHETEPGGFLPREALAILKGVAKEGIAAMEAVEVSPPYDISDITALVAVRAMVDVLASMTKHGRIGGKLR